MLLHTMLMTAKNRKPGQVQDSQLCLFMELKALSPLLYIHISVKEISPLDFLKLMDTPEDYPYFSSDNFRASMLASVIETLLGFGNVHEGFSSFPEIFLPILKLLPELVEQKLMPNALQDKIRDVSQLIEKKAHEHHMLRQPVPIKLLNPKFEENGNQDWTARFLVREKCLPRVGQRNSTRYQNLILADPQGNDVQATIFENQIEKLQDTLKLFTSSYISNVGVKVIQEPYRISPLRYQWNEYTRQMVILATLFLSSTFFIQYLFAAVIYVRPTIPVRMQYGTVTVQEIVLVDQESIPVVLTLWDPYAKIEDRITVNGQFFSHSHDYQLKVTSYGEQLFLIDLKYGLYHYRGFDIEKSVQRICRLCFDSPYIRVMVSSIISSCTV